MQHHDNHKRWFAIVKLKDVKTLEILGQNSDYRIHLPLRVMRTFMRTGHSYL